MRGAVALQPVIGIVATTKVAPAGDWAVFSSGVGVFCAGEGVCGCGGYSRAEVGDEGVDDGGVEDGDA